MSFISRRQVRFAILLLIALQPDLASSTSENSEQCSKTHKEPEKQQEPLLGLPASSSTGSQTLNVGESLSLYDQMGPLIINEDGSTRRIANWGNLTEREQQNILRVVSSRNKRRIARLKEVRGEVHKMAVDAGIIPDVVEDVAEVVLLKFNLQYEGLEDWANGAEFSPKAVSKQPTVSWSAPAPQGSASPEALFTLLMVDPDAPSRAEHTFRHWLHWLVVDLKGICNSTTCQLQPDCVPAGGEDSDGVYACGRTLAAYAGPTPPRGSGPHRYVALLYRQAERYAGQLEPNGLNGRRAKFDLSEHVTGPPVAVRYFVSQNT